MKFRVAAACAVLCLAAPSWSDIVRDSVGQHRAELERMELMPFPADAWSKVGSWTGGEALTAATMKDKAVMIVTWASWHPNSLKALALAQRVADANPGLIVVGVHHQQGWAEAAEAATSRGAKFRMALDTNGEFRKALKVDHDPSFYFIDKAGQLRYAGVAQQSVEEASSQLSGETAQQASEVPGALKTKAASDAAAAQKTKELRGSVDLSQLPPVPPNYTKPGESAYNDANWPKLSEQAGKDSGLLDQNGKVNTPKLAFNPQGFFPAKPELAGRALVIYMWHPEMLVSFDKVVPLMDQIQVSNGRDVAIVGALVPIGKLDQQRQQQFNEAPEKAEVVAKRAKEFLGTRQFRHALAADIQASAMSSLGQQAMSGQNKAPFAIIASSDGIIRWAGNPLSVDFKYALDGVLANDPGIAARRAADREFLQGGK